MLDELDFQLINALQITPRSPWSVLAPALRTDASTLSRRWNRLTEAGLAWTTCYVLPERIQAVTPSGRRLRSSFALIEIRCEAGRREQVIAAISHQPAVINIECTSGPRELSVNVSAPSPNAIDAYVAQHISVLPGVTSTSTRFVRTIYQEGSEFDLKALLPAQRATLEKMLRHPPDMTPAEPSELTEQIIRALQADVRRPAVEVAAAAGISVPMARRTIARLLQSDWVRMRADFAHDIVGWNASVHLWLRVPQDRLGPVASGLAQHPAVRLCASTLATDNMVATLWLRELTDLDEIEELLRAHFPEAQVTDRWMVPRVVKRMGSLFDESGRRCGYVPVPLPRTSTP